METKFDYFFGVGFLFVVIGCGGSVWSHSHASTGIVNEMGGSGECWLPLDSSWSASVVFLLCVCVGRGSIFQLCLHRGRQGSARYVSNRVEGRR